jgi:2',3'-cyclic-nucleotide 2'-phosphodiesterase (5'-nucleotidase family)
MHVCMCHICTQPKQVGFFGVCTEHTPRLSHPSPDVQFTPIIPAARAAITHLQQHNGGRGVDVIVGITHVTLLEDRQLARSCPEIDLILGYKTHKHSCSHPLLDRSHSVLSVSVVTIICRAQRKRAKR